MEQQTVSASRIWRALLFGLSSLTASWLVLWGFRLRLVFWFADPLIQDWQRSPCSHEIRMPDGYGVSPLPSFLYLSIVGAALLALPFMVRMLWMLFAPRARASEKIAGLPFVLLSYLVVIGGFFSAQWLFLPLVVKAAVGPAWCWDTGALDGVSVLNHFMQRASLAVVGLVLGLELCLIGVVLWRSKRS